MGDGRLGVTEPVAKDPRTQADISVVVGTWALGWLATAKIERTPRP